MPSDKNLTPIQPQPRPAKPNTSSPSAMLTTAELASLQREMSEAQVFMRQAFDSQLAQKAKGAT